MLRMHVHLENNNNLFLIVLLHRTKTAWVCGDFASASSPCILHRCTGKCAFWPRWRGEVWRAGGCVHALHCAVAPSMDPLGNGAAGRAPPGGSALPRSTALLTLLQECLLVFPDFVNKGSFFLLTMSPMHDPLPTAHCLPIRCPVQLLYLPLSCQLHPLAVTYGLHLYLHCTCFKRLLLSFLLSFQSSIQT